MHRIHHSAAVRFCWSFDERAAANAVFRKQQCLYFHAFCILWLSVWRVSRNCKMEYRRKKTEQQEKAGLFACRLTRIPAFALPLRWGPNRTFEPDDSFFTDLDFLYVVWEFQKKKQLWHWLHSRHCVHLFHKGYICSGPMPAGPVCLSPASHRRLLIQIWKESCNHTGLQHFFFLRIRYWCGADAAVRS